MQLSVKLSHVIDMDKKYSHVVNENHIRYASQTNPSLKHQDFISDGESKRVY
jgi:hypothetical protein